MPVRITDNDVRELRRMRASVRRLDTPARDAPTPAGLPSKRDGQFVPFVAKITNATQDGSNKRWKYEFIQQQKTIAGYAGWTDVSAGVQSNTTLGEYAYNFIEDQNSSAGVYGNGVDDADLTGTFDIQKVPTNTRVLISLKTAFSGVAEYWFSYENGVTGDCP